jgi:hypothetical protein
MLYTQLAALTLAAIAFAVSGCGGSSKSKSTVTAAATTSTQSTTAATPTTIAAGKEIKIKSGPPLPRAVWIAKGDAICASASAKINSVKATTTQDFARLFPQAAAYEHIEAIEMSKLVPPTANANDWAQMITGVQKFSEYSIKLGGYARENKLTIQQPLLALANATQKQVALIAKRDGFKICSESSRA